MGKVTPLSKDEIRKMELVCKLAARSLEYIGGYIKAGITTDELDKIVYEHTLSLGCEPACLGYNGYPKTICASVNNVICHGLPGNQRLVDGDIVNIDITHKKDGFFGDCSATFFVGQVSQVAKDITQAALEARDIGIEMVRPGTTTGDIGFAIDKFVTRKGYNTVKEIGGHGIGRKFHDEPFVPSYGKKGRGDILVPWTCLTVEPMVNEGAASIKEIDIPNSSIKYYETTDGRLSAQFEHTLLITDTGFQILTLP
jgi:methionyl aminopeptidase